MADPESMRPSALLIGVLLSVSFACAKPAELARNPAEIARIPVAPTEDTQDTVSGSARGEHEDGKRDGAWVFFDQHGRKRVDGFYYQGKMHGKWSFFDVHGNRWALLEYYDGRRVTPVKPSSEQRLSNWVTQRPTIPH